MVLFFFFFLFGDNVWFGLGEVNCGGTSLLSHFTVWQPVASILQTQLNFYQHFPVASQNAVFILHYALDIY